jgi:hypothetical protein
VRFVYQDLRGFALQARQADVEAGSEEVSAIRQDQVHFDVDGKVRWKRDLHLAGHKSHRTFEAGRPIGGERLRINRGQLSAASITASAKACGAS